MRGDCGDKLARDISIAKKMMEILAYFFVQAQLTSPNAMNLYPYVPQRQPFYQSWLLVLILLSSLLVSPAALAQRVLERGMAGSEVRQVQERLRELRYLSHPPDGVYGPATEQAVKDFQRAYSLDVDGKVGAETRSALLERTYSPSTNPSTTSSTTPTVRVPRRLDTPPRDYGLNEAQIKELQRELRDRGFDPGTIDGVIGSQTEAAIRDFQRANGLTVDGIPSPETLAVLELGGSPTASGENRPYVVVIPDPDFSDLARVKREFSDARFARSRRGSYIWAGAFTSYEAAQARTYNLRGLGFDARVVYF